MKDVIGKIICISDKKLKLTRQSIEENIDKIELVYNMLEDARSKNEYETEIVFRGLYGALDREFLREAVPIMPKSEFDLYVKEAKEKLISGEIPNFELLDNDIPNFHEFIAATNFLIAQYKYEDIFKVEEGDIFLDCGSCMGETVIWAANSGAKKVYAFEPSKFNHEFLVRNLENFVDKDKYEVVPFGVGADECILEFEYFPNNPAKMRMATEESVNIVKFPITTIDAWQEKTGVVPTFIKMDIEGAELDAIKGAANTIKKYKPKLAICLYHKNEHMWEIPLLIKEYYKDYRFYCKKNNDIYEFVLYCIA